ncbi:hypothetical protein SmJEL517_g04863 [Synchytrium microbalum]|uniref:Uncharacterized protein n=1 Tax=Synchytrium microbalum TaxID=1806994 RepID=A0A507BWX2_9FUNG|nr:uncharacterized protein SmJEL517_g04863 [Synchytrium microbalum]TPX31942.1 hypothetical protein SmJEL517_g04863 [Synchytrium microbalum]
MHTRTNILLAVGLTVFAGLAAAQTTTNVTAAIQEQYALLGTDNAHPYVIPYCEAPPINISLADAGFFPRNDTDMSTDFMVINVTTPIDLTPYDNARGIMIVDYQLPAGVSEASANMSVTQVLFTAKDAMTYDSQLVNSSITMQVAFTVISASNATAAGGSPSKYTVLGSPSIRAPVPDGTNTTLTAADAGEFVVELGLLVMHNPTFDATKVFFTDMVLRCLPAPSVADLVSQNITFYSNETSPGVWQNGTTAGN